MPYLNVTRRQVGWAMYDWANSAFAVTVIAGFFPVFFKQYWSAESAVTTSTFYLGVGTSLANLLIVLIAPVIGALADHSGYRRRLLVAFATAGMAATAGLYLVAQGQWMLAICIYALAVIGFSGANVFYDAMLIEVSKPEERNRVSALGFALGYLGGGLLFLINVVMTLNPSWFGLADQAAAVRWSFISVALWWGVFTIPLLFSLPPREHRSRHTVFSVSKAFHSVVDTLRSIRHYPQIWTFLLAYWLYIDGVATIIRLAVDYGLSIGLPSDGLIKALLMVQFIGFPATLIFGVLADRLGTRKSLWIALWAYVGVTIYAYFLDTTTEFFILAGIIGLVQGAVQALSRSYYSQLLPADKATEFFGFMNMMGKAAAVLGPLLVGVTAAMTGNPRLGLVSVLILFFAGMVLLGRVSAEPEPQA